MRKAKTWTEPPLHIVRRRDRNTYTVRSSRPGVGVYLVDFENRYFPKGRCDCEDFNKRIEPEVIRHRTPRRLTCVHIDAVNEVIRHGKTLCEAAGLTFHPNLIPA